MANETQAAGAHIGAKGGAWKSIGILAAIAQVSYIAIMIAIDKGAPENPAAMPRFVGEVIGGAIPSFVLGIIVLLIVRFFRRRSGAPFAGLLSGAIVTLALSYAQYIGELSHLARLQ